MVPLKVAISGFFLFYRYKFLSKAKDKNLYRLPKRTRTCSDYRLDKIETFNVNKSFLHEMTSPNLKRG